MPVQSCEGDPRSLLAQTPGPAYLGVLFRDRIAFGDAWLCGLGRDPCSVSLWPAQDLTEKYVGKAMQQHVRVGTDGKIKWEEAPSELRHFHWSSRDGP